MSDSDSHHGSPATHSHAADQIVLILIGGFLLGYCASAVTGFLGPLANHEPHEVDAVSHTWAVIPFVMLLGAIAVFPLIDFTTHWWDHNHNKLLVAAGLALITLGYLSLGHPAGGFRHAAHTLIDVIAYEYVPFIILLFSLYTICGGIRIAGDLPAHAWTNTMFMLAGGALASFIGTTGAAMLLIRPLLETNSERKRVAHTVVFFIFVVCNCGGLLLPLGDPPLFLGYLQGVDFLWTMRLWPSWLFVNGLLLAIYWAFDHFICYPKESKEDIRRDETRTHKLRFSGLNPNAWLLLGVVLAVALLDPGKPFPGTNWHPLFYLREAVQLTLVLISLLAGSKSIRAANSFSYVAIVEVACLFVGIFICMQPALEILRDRGGELGINSPETFFWASGTLSSILDNAPTYLVFFEAAKSIDFEGARMAGVAEKLLIGISLGSVCMGAMTYIGNGPNFMVKTIAEKSGVKMPSFFGYMIYSFLVLLPILFVNTLLFLR